MCKFGPLTLQLSRFLQAYHLSTALVIEFLHRLAALVVTLVKFEIWKEEIGGGNLWVFSWRGGDLFCPRTRFPTFCPSSFKLLSSRRGGLCCTFLKSPRKRLFKQVWANGGREAILLRIGGEPLNSSTFRPAAS